MAAGELLTGSSILVAQAQTGVQSDEVTTEQSGTSAGPQDAGQGTTAGEQTGVEATEAPTTQDTAAQDTTAQDATNADTASEAVQTGDAAQEQTASEGTSVVVEGSQVVGTEQTGELYEETHVAETGHEKSVFPPFDSTTFGPQLFWLAITFGVLYLLMSKIALPRIGEILEVRRDRIEGDLAEAERLRQKTDQAIQTYESELADARARSHGIADETRNKIKAEMNEKRREVETDLAKQVASAEARIEKTKTDALANVDQIAAETAVVLVGKLAGKVSIKTARSAVSTIVKG